MSSPASGYIGPFRPLTVVHHGRATEIWQVINERDNKRYAMKIITEDHRTSRQQIAQLKREFAICQQVNHPLIIRAIEMGDHKRRLYITFEWFAAPNLKRRIGQGVQKFAHLVPDILKAAAEALEYFHQLGWVHRDVKPENFLVDDQGQVKLLDLALAHRAKGTIGRLLSLKSKIQGTPSYMSPEQIRGAVVDQRSDIYSFGCMAYEMLAGNAPFTGLSQNEVLSRHLSVTPPQLIVAAPNVTSEFSRLVSRCMAKDPSERPQSMGDFLISLQRHRLFKVQPKPPEKAS